MDNNKLNELLKNSLYVNKLLDEKHENSAYDRLLKKDIIEKEIFFNGDSLNNVSFKEGLDITISDEYALKGTSLKLACNADIENITPRPWMSIYFDLSNFNIKKYNRVSIDLYVKASGYNGFYVQMGMGELLDSPFHNTFVLPNKWNHIIYEYDDIKKDNINNFIINPWTTGTPDEALPNIEFYIDNISFEKVIPDRVIGWNSGDDIIYSHLGYYNNKEKLAFTSSTKEKEFSLLNEGRIVYQNKIEEIHNLNETFYILDFSDYKISGEYQIQLGDKLTKPFLISNQIYDEALIKSLNFLRALRCGTYIEGIHSACHLNCRTINKNGDTVPSFGGWHDAGDVSQFEIPTAEITSSLCEMAEIYQNKDDILFERIKEEVRIGVTWLLQTRFGDGERSLAVLYRIWRHNKKLKNNVDVENSVAENGPFENFLSSIALAKAVKIFKDTDPILADYCLRASLEDYQFGLDGYKKGLYSKRWGPSITSQTLGSALASLALIYDLTKDHSLYEEASILAKRIIKCQETEGKVVNKELCGFFYEDEEHHWVLTYEHRGHEQSPIEGLVMAATYLKDHKDYKLWLESIKLYASFVKNSMKYTYPYNLLPSTVYILGKINPDHFTLPEPYCKDQIDGLHKLEAQVKRGIKVGENAYLRIFPISLQRRGFHATLLSKTKAVSLSARILNDNELYQIAINQLEWVMGKNPFNSSTMYGVGYNYHPLYVAFSPQIVGSLPVGIMTKKDEDQPFWPVRTDAVYKEIWGHTTCKFLFVLADIMKGLNNE